MSVGRPTIRVGRWRGMAIAAAVLCAAAGIGAWLRDAGPREGSGLRDLSIVDDTLVITGPDGELSVAYISDLLDVWDDAATKVLLHDTSLYVADLPAGTITRLDPATVEPEGTPWTAGGPLADAAIDGTGTVHALRIDGDLQPLAWTVTALASAASPTLVPGAGPRSALVAHDHGVTTLVPDHGTAVRDGTPRPVPGLTGRILPAERAPTDLIPVTIDGTPTLLIITDASVTMVDTRRFGCDRPGRPAAFAARIYVPCRGTGMVVVLTPAGDHLPPDIRLGPSGDPLLVLNQGRLHAWLPGTAGVTIDADGTPRPAPTPPVPFPPRRPGTTSPGPPPTSGPQPTSAPPTTATVLPPPKPPTVTQPVTVLPSSPPTGPADGDIVIVAINETPAQSVEDCGFQDCFTRYYYYTVVLAPPPSWQTFSGTCTLRQVRTDTQAVIQRPMDCDDTRTPLLPGDGHEYTFTVEACAAGCVRSNSVTRLLKAPLEWTCDDGEFCIGEL